MLRVEFSPLLLWALLLTSCVVNGNGRQGDEGSCPSACTCRPMDEQPCDWCAGTVSDSPADPSSQGAASGPAGSSANNDDDDQVSCEGCGSDPATADDAGLAARTHVACPAAGLRSFPVDVPSSAVAVDLSGNRLERLDVRFVSARRSLSSLANLRLRANAIELIADGAFLGGDGTLGGGGGPGASLRALDLAENRLTRLDVASFAGLDRLVQLDLSGNRISEIGDGTFGEMRDLTRLDLRDNRIERLGVGTLRGLSGLRYLLLAGNRIQFIDRRAFRTLEKLVYVVLKGNAIGDQPIRFQFHSPFLTYIDVSECGLTDVPKGLPGSARYVQLRRNNMTSLGRQSFIESPYVNILVLDDNVIDDVEHGTFEKMTDLQQLWLSGNRLRRVPRGLPASVQRLLLDFNRIENLTDVFPSSSQIMTLSLTGNQISTITHNALTPLTSLRSLDVSNNRLRTVLPRTFSTQSQLHLLQLSGNQLDSLPDTSLDGLTSLRVLSLTYVPTDVVRVGEGALEGVAGGLTRLELDSSPGLARAVFDSERIVASLGGAGELSARSADLTRIRPEIGRRFPVPTGSSQRRRWLRLTSVRWHCDRDLIWLRDYLRSVSAPGMARGSYNSTSGPDADDEENRCATPRRLSGRHLLSLNDDEFDPVVLTSTSARPEQDFVNPDFRKTSTSLPPPASYLPPAGNGNPSVSTPTDGRRAGNWRRSDETYGGLDDFDETGTGNRNKWRHSDIDDFRPRDSSDEQFPPYRYFDNFDKDLDVDVTLSQLSFYDTRPTAPGVPTPPSESLSVASSHGKSDSVTLIAVGATVGLTVVLVVIILTIILRFVRDKKQRRPLASSTKTTSMTSSDTDGGKSSGGSSAIPLPVSGCGGCGGGGSDDGVIKYRHANGSLLYYTPAAAPYRFDEPEPETIMITNQCACGTMRAAAAMTSSPIVAVRSPPEVGSRLATCGEMAALLSTPVCTRDAAALRAQQAEHLRVYKWEDF